MSSPNDDDPPLSVQGRIFALLFGPTYLMGLSYLFTEITEIPQWIVTLVVFACATVIIAVIANFCVKFVSRLEGDRQISLASILLLFVPVAIYLSGVRILVQALPSSELAWWQWTIVAAMILTLLSFTTVILLWLGEATIWLMLRLRRIMRPKRNSKV